MADTHGSVKLADALQHFRLTWLIGFGEKEGRYPLTLRMIDADELEAILDGEIDPTTGIIWVQLPLATVEDIVCQAGERPTGAELDKQFSGLNAELLALTGIHPAAPGKRRAPPTACKWHTDRKRDRSKDHSSSEQCGQCHKWFKDTSAIVSATILDKPTARRSAKRVE